MGNSTGLPFIIQERIASAEEGDTICVPPGTYFECIDFLGKAITLLGTAGPENTVIDADWQGSVVSLKSGEDTTSVISGFTIRHGCGTYDMSHKGGGIYAYNAGFKVLDCIIVENNVGKVYDRGYGGGIKARYTNVVIKDCIVRENQAPSAGGGIDVGYGTAIIVNNQILLNRAYGDYHLGSYGGGLGGGLRIAECNDVLVQGNLFYNNTACRPGSKYLEPTGGGILLYLGDAVIKENLFLDNSTVFAGALYIGSYTEGTIVTRNLFIGNSAGDEWSSGIGGAIEVIASDPRPLIFNNTFLANGAYQGESGSPAGGSLAHYRYGGAVYNNIFAFTVSGKACTFAYANHHHNCYWENADGDVSVPGEGTIFEDPRFVGESEFSYRLKPTSPCIEAGSIGEVESTYCGEVPDIGLWEECLDFILPFPEGENALLKYLDSLKEKQSIGTRPVDSKTGSATSSHVQSAGSATSNHVQGSDPEQNIRSKKSRIKKHVQ